MSISQATKAAFKFAFPQTLPILAGFLFLGIAYGIFMNSLGFSAIYPILMSLFIFAGSMEFVAANLLLMSFQPVNAFFLTLMVNARHLFYGISMLDRYGKLERGKWYVIYGMCDESFAINSTLNIPNHLDKGKVMFFVTMLNQIYWVTGATIGGIFGSFITFNTAGLEFVMTALFVVIFLENWLTTKQHHSALVGLAFSALSLWLFGGERFIIPAMLAILAVLTFLRPTLQNEKRAMI